MFLLFSCSVMSNSLRTHDCSMPGLPVLYHHPEFAHTQVYLVCDAIQLSHLLSSCLQSFPASGSFLMSWSLASGGQRVGASASASVLPMNIQDCFPLGLNGLTSLQSKGITRVFSNTTVKKHQFFRAQPSLWSNSHIHT